MLEYVIVTALIINGLMLFMDKVGFIYWVQLKVKSDFIYKMFGCNFCIAHHLTLLYIIPFFLIDFNYLYFAFPLMVAGLIHVVR